MKNKVFIVSPANVATGGTELLQQLCTCLNGMNIASFMIYTEEYKDSAVLNRFGKYQNPIATAGEISIDDTVVIPETRIDLIPKFSKYKLYIWWLSVDNYYGAKRLSVDVVHKVYYAIKDFRNLSVFHRCQHLVQSEYARQFLINEKGVDKHSIQYLSDYLNHTYLDEVANAESGNRENNILYNPKKGIEFTKILMDEIKEYNWIPLQGFTPEEMRNVMLRSKLYVDFGNHPGKDRIPREAAICGCCIITGTRGAAQNDFDVRINKEYKFSDINKQLRKIHEVVTDCIENYNERTRDFDVYRQFIMQEEEAFSKDVYKIFGKSKK